MHKFKIAVLIALMAGTAYARVPGSEPTLGLDVQESTVVAQKIVVQEASEQGQKNATSQSKGASDVSVARNTFQLVENMTHDCFHGTCAVVDASVATVSGMYNVAKHIAGYEHEYETSKSWAKASWNHVKSACSNAWNHTSVHAKRFVQDCWAGAKTAGRTMRSLWKKVNSSKVPAII